MLAGLTGEGELVNGFVGVAVWCGREGSGCGGIGREINGIELAVMLTLEEVGRG